MNADRHTPFVRRRRHLWSSLLLVLVLIAAAVFTSAVLAQSEAPGQGVGAPAAQQPTLPPRPTVESTLPSRPTPASTLPPRPTVEPQPTAPGPTAPPAPKEPRSQEPTAALAASPQALPVGGDGDGLNLSYALIWGVGILAVIAGFFLYRRKGE